MKKSAKHFIPEYVERMSKEELEEEIERLEKKAKKQKLAATV